MKLCLIDHSRLAAAVACVLFSSGSGLLQAQQASGVRPAPLASAPPAPAPGKVAESERRIRERLGSLKLDRVSFDQMDFEQVLTYLRTKIKEVDRQGVSAGINLIVKTNPKQTPVTFDRKNISIIEALQSCGELAGYRLRFDETGVTFVPAPFVANPAERAALAELEQNVADVEAELAELQQRQTSVVVEERIKAVRAVLGELLAKYYRAKYHLSADGATKPTSSLAPSSSTTTPTIPK